MKLVFEHVFEDYTLKKENMSLPPHSKKNP